MSNIDLIASGRTNKETAVATVSGDSGAGREHFLSELKQMMEQLAVQDEKGKNIHETAEKALNNANPVVTENNSSDNYIFPTTNFLNEELADMQAITEETGNTQLNIDTDKIEQAVLTGTDDMGADIIAMLTAINQQPTVTVYNKELAAQSDTDVAGADNAQTSQPLVGDISTAKNGLPESDPITEEDLPTAEKFIKYYKEVLLMSKDILAMIKQDDNSNNSKEESSHTGESVAGISVMDIMPKVASAEALKAAADILAGTRSINVGTIETATASQDQNAAADTLDQPDDPEIKNQNINEVKLPDDLKQTEKATSGTTLPEDLEIVQNTPAKEKTSDKNSEQVSASKEKPSTPSNSVNTSGNNMANQSDSESTDSNQSNNGQNNADTKIDQNVTSAPQIKKSGSVFESTLKTETKQINNDIQIAGTDTSSSRSVSSSETQQDAKQVDRTLEWESAKDAVKLAKLVQQAGQDGATKLTVRLNPVNLGRIEIQLTEVGGRLDAKILANSQEARNFLASHGEAITRQLLEKGIHIDNMDFGFHDSMGKQNDAGGQQNGAKQSSRTYQEGEPDANDSEELIMEKTPEGLYA